MWVRYCQRASIAGRKAARPSVQRPLLAAPVSDVGFQDENNVRDSGSGGAPGWNKMKLADTIRAYARDRMVAPCRDAGVHGFSIRAGDVHDAMGLKARLPAVCAALRSRKFQEQSGIELLRVEGP